LPINSKPRDPPGSDDPYLPIHVEKFQLPHGGYSNYSNCKAVATVEYVIEIVPVRDWASKTPRDAVKGTRRRQRQVLPTIRTRTSHAESLSGGAANGWLCVKVKAGESPCANSALWVERHRVHSCCSRCIVHRSLILPDSNPTNDFNANRVLLAFWAVICLAPQRGFWFFFFFRFYFLLLKRVTPVGKQKISCNGVTSSVLYTSPKKVP
jgi:hypothetical protein